MVASVSIMISLVFQIWYYCIIARRKSFVVEFLLLAHSVHQTYCRYHYRPQQRLHCSPAFYSIFTNRSVDFKSVFLYYVQTFYSKQMALSHLKHKHNSTPPSLIIKYLTALSPTSLEFSLILPVLCLLAITRIMS